MLSGKWETHLQNSNEKRKTGNNSKPFLKCFKSPGNCFDIKNRAFVSFPFLINNTTTCQHSKQKNRKKKNYRNLKLMKTLSSLS